MTIKFKNLDQFKVRLRQFNDITEEQAAALLKRVALQVLTGVVEKTPVDTGRARGNWQVAIDTAANTATINRDDAGGSIAISAGTAALTSVKPFSTVVIYNNVEYIVALEQGHSQQAPQGMVAVTIAEVEAQFR
jgi:hypothetical protein